MPPAVPKAFSDALFGGLVARDFPETSPDWHGRPVKTRFVPMRRLSLSRDHAYTRLRFGRYELHWHNRPWIFLVGASPRWKGWGEAALECGFWTLRLQWHPRRPRGGTPLP